MNARPALLLTLVLAAAACQHRPVADPAAARPSFERTVHLPPLRVARHRSVPLWIARPLGGPQRPLVPHLTGDSGRHGIDLLLFTALTRWGYSPSSSPRSASRPTPTARSPASASRPTSATASCPVTWSRSTSRTGG